MGLRELLILLLGFAIVAVILRGLYVAMQARRGQIKLAIDKNIPQDVDLDALEMAELPGGGARVVSRGSSDEVVEKTTLETAKERAAAMDLGEDDSAVPVLMDSVAVASASATDHAEDEEGYLDPDDVLLDYEEDQDEQVIATTEAASGLDAVRPDYPDEQTDTYQEEQGELVFADSEEPGMSDGRIEPSFGDEIQHEDSTDTSEEESYSEAASSEVESYVNESYEDDVDDELEQDNNFDEYEGYEDDLEEDAESEEDVANSYDDYEESEYEEEYAAAESEVEDRIENEVAEQDRVEPGFDPDAVLDDSDSFSMTAGERIGYQEEPASAGRSLFSRFSSNDSNDEIESSHEEEAVPAKRSSLFSAIRKKVVDTSLERFKSEPKEDVDTDDDLIEDIVENHYAEEVEDYVEDEPVQYDIEQQAELEEELEPPASTELRPASSSGQPTEIRQQNTSAQPSEVVVLNVMAKEGYAFHGEDLMQLLITSGLKFGDMAIFHQRLGNDSRGPVIFSVANVLNPGTFDLNDMANFSTVGISMFLALPSPINNLEAFDMMLGTAQRLCEVLDGDLKDDHRNVMTAQTIEHYRQRIRDFELRQLKAAGSRG